MGINTFTDLESDPIMTQLITATQLDMPTIASYLGANPATGVVSSVAISSSDLTITGSPITSTGTINLSFPAINSKVGTFNTVTVNAKGLITSATNVAYLTSVSSSNVISALGYTPVNPSANTNMTGTLTFNGVATITGLPSPVNSSDVANKSYVDGIAAGLSWKEACQAATTANLTATFVNNGGTGDTLTNSGTQAAFVVDGYTASVNDRIVVKNQTTTYENGVYVVTSIGSTTTNWVLTRSTDFETAAEAAGAAVFVENGTTQANTQWVQIDTVTTFDSSPIVFTQLSGTSAGVSSLTASTGISVSQTTGAVTVTNTGVTSIAGTAGNIIASGPTGSVTLNLATAGTAGSYVQVTTDNYGRVISGATTISTSNLSGALQASQFPALTGDITTAAGSLVTTLAAVNTNTGTFGSGTQVGSFVVNSKGLITGASNIPIAIAAAQVTGLAASATTNTTDASNIISGTLAQTQLPALSATGDAHGTGAVGTGTIPLTLATVNSNVGTFNTVTVNAKGLVTAASNTTYLTGNQTITLSGDVTGTGTTSIPVKLAASGVTAGSYGSATFVPVITVDTKGRVTSVSTAAVTAAVAAGGTDGNLQYNDAGGSAGVSTMNFTSTSPEQVILGDGTAAFSFLGVTGATSSGDLVLQAGNLGTGAGSILTLAGGNANGTTGAGGTVVIAGGDGGSTTGAAGDVIIESGASQTGQVGGSVSIATSPGGPTVTRVTIDDSGSWDLAGTDPGIEGQVLTSQGTGTPPVWQIPVNTFYATFYGGA